MRVARWGNSLAVRLPRPVVDALGLKEGDEVEVSAKSEGRPEVAHDQRRAEAMARIRALSVPLPPEYKFDREEANSRGGFKVESEEPDGR